MTRRHLAGLTSVLALLACAPPALALDDHAGQAIPATSTSGTAAQEIGRPSVIEKLFLPDSPGDDDPAVLDTLGSSATPEDDLGTALDALRDASSASGAQAARRRALDILLGNLLPGKAYSGMPLLNWDVPRKVKDVPPGGDVRVKEVRFGDTVLTDTALLRFKDPDQPFTITYEIAELGPGSPGELAPTPLLSDSAGPIGGLHSILQPLALAPMQTGTTAKSRFTDALGVTGGGKEQTRTGVQEITVTMPPPRYVDAVLDPDLVANGDPMAAGGNPLAALRPATNGRVAEIDSTFGFSGDAPSDAEQGAAIAKIGDKAPERMLYEHLRDLNADDLAADNALGVQDRELVSAMRAHTELPAGFGGDPAAAASMVLLNGETYRTRDSVRLSPGAPVKVSVTNGDDYTRTISATQLFGRQATLGAVDWGSFDFAPVDLGAAATLAPGESHTFTITPRGDAFELVVGDADHGEHGSWALALDRGPLRQSVEFDNTTGPLHMTQDANGDMWMTLSGVDAVARITPAADLHDSKIERFLIPGGNHDADPAKVGLAPHALHFDQRGMLWVTLDVGNAIARIDPAKVHDNTEDGITIYHLNGCTTGICPAPFPPEDPPPPPSRMPVQMDIMPDGAGNTVVVFSEENASAIGALRVAPNGTELDKVDYPCSCKVPLGLQLDPDGSVWFSEAIENRIGHLRLDQAEPFKASAASLEHFTIPSGVQQVDPALSPQPFTSSIPHSLALDRHGRIWFSEEGTGKIGLFDPERGRAGTTAGMREFTLQRNDFGRDPLPADLAVDRRDTVFWTDEYGDAVGSLNDTGTEQRWRPGDRNSLTDSPALDSEGNLWFLEPGASLMTRISGITAGAARPDAPPSFVARTAQGTVSATGLAEAKSVDVAVVRNGQIARAVGAVGVDRGTFTVDAGVQAGDTVQVTPRGEAAKPVSFTVASLQAGSHGDGTVAGRATRGGTAVADHVTVSGGGGAREARIDPVNGAFSAAGAPASGEVTWSEGTPAGVFTTVSHFGPSAGAPAPNAPQGDAPAPRTGGDRRTPDRPVATPPAAERAPNACRDLLWLVRHGTSRRIPLLGTSARTVLNCIGAPLKHARHGNLERWRYGNNLILHLVRGRVTTMELISGRFRSLPDGLTIGSRVGVVARSLGTSVLSGHRALLRRSDGRYADVRLRVRRERVSAITVTLRRFSDLDPAGRRLARRRG